MEITEALQQLAKFSDPILPVVSVYLNTHWDDRHQRAEAAAFLATHVRQARALDPPLCRRRSERRCHRRRSAP